MWLPSFIFHNINYAPFGSEMRHCFKGLKRLRLVTPPARRSSRPAAHGGVVAREDDAVIGGHEEMILFLNAIWTS
jgi:hypothetical protein